MEDMEEKKKKRVCVTGASGFVGSWLVKLLLSKDYIVHGTVRDPSDEKNDHLKKLDNASDNLQFFKADLLDYKSLTAAIAGCEGVFHVASSVPSSKLPNPEIEIIAPALNGTLNVLEACSEGKVKRVIVVSSLAAVGMNPSWSLDKVRNEECWSDMEYDRRTENWYSLSKTLAEINAFDYAAKHKLDVVTVCPSLCIGPLLQATMNASSLVLISLLKGDRLSVENKVRHLVDVRDVADALLMVYEKPEASGRYICAPHAIKMSDLIDILKSMYPQYNYPNNFVEPNNEPRASSEKLKMLGWECRPLKETLIDTVEYYQVAGLLEKD
uniref:Putative cinnamoyl-CoA reductase 5 n=1 Tax=Freesia hybrid cultivar TaxID=867926 RepID=A0A1L3GY97_9ASPA|nr:putative cinnamoyl-CoA reductase 5 [Freesia hybrid cultivar]